MPYTRRVGQRNFIRGYMQTLTTNAQCVAFLNMVDELLPKLAQYVTPLMNVQPIGLPTLMAAVDALSDADLQQVIASMSPVAGWL